MGSECAVETVRNVVLEANPCDRTLRDVFGVEDGKLGAMAAGNVDLNENVTVVFIVQLQCATQQ